MATTATIRWGTLPAPWLAMWMHDALWIDPGRWATLPPARRRAFLAAVRAEETGEATYGRIRGDTAAAVAMLAALRAVPDAVWEHLIACTGASHARAGAPAGRTCRRRVG